MKKLILFILLFLTQFIFTQKANSAFLYKGFLDTKTPITLYLKISVNACDGSNNYEAMYKYDNSNKWIQLNVSPNSNEKSFCLVEQNFSGVMILSKTAKSFSGKWINPNGQKQLKVILNLQNLSVKLKNELEDKYEKLNYENNDC